MLKDKTCPHCDAPWKKGTGLYECGEGIGGMVHGGCRVYYTGRYIKELHEQIKGLKNGKRT